jgi:hypothetical protein
MPRRLSAADAAAKKIDDWRWRIEDRCLTWCSRLAFRRDAGGV